MRAFALATLLASVVFATQAEAQGRRRSRGKDRAPKVGAKAPEFKLRRLGKDGKPSKKTVKLSSFKGKRAVALVFGSYT